MRPPCIWRTGKPIACVLIRQVSLACTQVQRSVLLGITAKGVAEVVWNRSDGRVVHRNAQLPRTFYQLKVNAHEREAPIDAAEYA